MYIDSGEALGELRQAGLIVSDENKTVEEIARANKLTPANVYQLIKKLERPDTSQPVAGAPAPVAAQSSLSGAPAGKSKPAAPLAAKEPIAPPRYTGDVVVERFEGKGIGRKTLAAICQELHLDCPKIQQKLNAKQVSIKDEETLKDAATRQGAVPIELLKIILVGEPI